MADFSLTTLFVVPVGNTLPSSGSTQNLTPGQFGVFKPDYAVATAGNIDDAGVKYFYLAQGRTNTFLQGSKRSDKIAGALQNAGVNPSNITEWYKVAGCGVILPQVTEVGEFKVKCGEIVTLTLRAHSSYLDTLHFNGLTRSVTINAPCCECDADPCVDTDVPALIDQMIEKLEQASPGINTDNIKLTDFFEFERVGADETAVLRITGKPLNVYAQPCDVAAFPHEYDRMHFKVFVYEGPATTADFIVTDACDIVAVSEIVQDSTFPTGTSEEIKQLEKNFHSYQAGYLKHLYKLAGFNGNFESWVTDGTIYDTFYIKFNEMDKSADSWGDYLKQDSMVIIAVPVGASAGIEAILEAALGTVDADNVCITTTTTTTGA
jgi:hypothetical protein